MISIQKNLVFCFRKFTRSTKNNTINFTGSASILSIKPCKTRALYIFPIPLLANINYNHFVHSNIFLIRQLRFLQWVIISKIIFRIWNKKWQKETRGNYQVFVYQRYRESTIHNRVFYSKSRCKILLLRKHKKKNERHTEIQFNTFYKDGWIRPVKIIQNNVYFTNIDL